MTYCWLDSQFNELCLNRVDLILRLGWNLVQSSVPQLTDSWWDPAIHRDGIPSSDFVI